MARPRCDTPLGGIQVKALPIILLEPMGNAHERLDILKMWYLAELSTLFLGLLFWECSNVATLRPCPTKEVHTKGINKVMALYRYTNP
jgi:hypothetical protein